MERVCDHCKSLNNGAGITECEGEVHMVFTCPLHADCRVKYAQLFVTVDLKKFLEHRNNSASPRPSCLSVLARHTFNNGIRILNERGQRGRRTHTCARTTGSPQEAHPPSPTPQLALRFHPAASHSKASSSNHRRPPLQSTLLKPTRLTFRGHTCSEDEYHVVFQCPLYAECGDK